jgi:hypothetical protein
VQRTIKIDMFLHIGCCWLCKAFSRRYFFPLVGHMYNDIVTFFRLRKKKNLRGGFSNNPTIDEVVYGFEEMFLLSPI